MHLIVDLEIRQVQVDRAVAHLEVAGFYGLAQGVYLLLHALVEGVHVQEARDGVEITDGQVALLVDEAHHPDLAEFRDVHLVERPFEVTVAARLCVTAECQEGISLI